MRWVKLTLPWPLRSSIPVDHLAVDLEQAGRDVAEAGRRRHREAAFHVGGDRRAGTTDRRTRLVSRRRRPAPGRAQVWSQPAAPRRRRPDRRAVSPRPALRGPVLRASRRSLRLVVDGTCGHRCAVGDDRLGHRAVVGEELLPRLADRLRVGLELLVHLLDEPRVRPERWLLDIWHCHAEDRTARWSIPRQLLTPLVLATAAPVTCRG